MSAEPNAAPSGPDSVVSLLRSIESRLGRMEERLDRLEARTRLETLEPFAATTVDVVDGWIRKAQQQGIDFDERGREVLALVERSTRPQTLRNLEHALDQADALPAAIATVVDILDGFVARQMERGVDPVELANGVAQSVEQLAHFVQSGALASLLDSGVFDPDTVELIGLAGKAMSDERLEGTKPLGLFGAMSAMSNPDVKRAVGFGLGVARRLGSNLDSTKKLR